jgi:hypothetical protein
MPGCSSTRDQQHLAIEGNHHSRFLLCGDVNGSPCKTAIYPDKQPLLTHSQCSEQQMTMALPGEIAGINASLWQKCHTEMLVEGFI